MDIRIGGWGWSGWVDGCVCHLWPFCKRINRNNWSCLYLRLPFSSWSVLGIRILWGRPPPLGFVPYTKLEKQKFAFLKEDWETPYELFHLRNPLWIVSLAALCPHGLNSPNSLNTQQKTRTHKYSLLFRQKQMTIWTNIICISLKDWESPYVLFHCSIQTNRYLTN